MVESTEKSLSPWAGAHQSRVLSLGPAVLGKGVAVDPLKVLGLMC